MFIVSILSLKLAILSCYYKCITVYCTLSELTVVFHMVATEASVRNALSKLQKVLFLCNKCMCVWSVLIFNLWRKKPQNISSQKLYYQKFIDNAQTLLSWQGSAMNTYVRSILSHIRWCKWTPAQLELLLFSLQFQCCRNTFCCRSCKCIKKRKRCHISQVSSCTIRVI